MKLIVLLCFVAYATAESKPSLDRNIHLFKYDPSDVYTLPEDIDDDKPAVVFQGNVMQAKVEKLQNFNGNKKFKLDLKTQNGIQVTSVGKLKDDKTFVVSGSYSFTGADGKRYKTRYTADELGYHPITELDLDIPEPQPVAASSNRFDNKDLLAGLKNRFQFLNQNLNSDASPSSLSGSAQSGDDFSYALAASDGYNYEAPVQQFETAPSIPSRQYLPVK
ncbi:pupal cuticle protein 20 [Ceratitis capitata]|nr:pupal cuticle protein 20 [Ceratitis capitata]